jgi:predicted transcriptional regulator
MINGVHRYMDALNVLSDGECKTLKIIKWELRIHKKTAEKFLEIAVQRGDVRRNYENGRPAYSLSPKGAEFIERYIFYKGLSQRVDAAIEKKYPAFSLNGIRNCVRILNLIKESNGNGGINAFRLGRKVGTNNTQLAKYLAFLEAEELVDSRVLNERDLLNGNTKRVYSPNLKGCQFSKDFAAYFQEHSSVELQSSLKTNY